MTSCTAPALPGGVAGRRWTQPPLTALAVPVDDLTVRQSAVFLQRL
jgi:hypothetical protein